jgi:hypothetical protein
MWPLRRFFYARRAGADNLVTSVCSNNVQNYTRRIQKLPGTSRRESQKGIRGREFGRARWRLRQRVDHGKWLPLASKIPRSLQIALMQRCPFEGHSESTRRKVAGDDESAPEIDDGLGAAIERVKVRRSMIGVEHPDDDPVEPRDLRHRCSGPLLVLRRRTGIAA